MFKVLKPWNLFKCIFTLIRNNSICKCLDNKDANLKWIWKNIKRNVNLNIEKISAEAVSPTFVTLLKWSLKSKKKIIIIIIIKMMITNKLLAKIFQNIETK